MSADAKFWLGCAAVVATIVTLFTLLIQIIDEDLWTEAPNDCFVRTHDVNTLFGEDSLTITEYCPSKD